MARSTRSTFFSLARCSATALIALAALSAAASAAAAPLPLIPAPQQARIEGDGFALDASVRVHADDPRAAATARQFIDGLARGSGLQLQLAPPASRPGARSIVFALDPKASASPEGYVLDIGRDGVRARAADPRGLFYAAATLWQLAPAAGQPRPAVLPGAHIVDAPRFGWRGLMLDSARQFQSVEQIKQLLDAMALHKLNTLHWHLTDDQGWRIEIPKYPKLTEIGGCRVASGDAGIGADGRPLRSCGFYRQAQIRELVAYAAARHITIVPEFDLPGHATAALAAYPQFGSIDTPLQVSNEWGVHANLFNASEETLAFFEDVLGEMIALFPGTYIHVGGDEAVKDQWKASPAAQARIRQLGLANEEQLQGWIIKRLERYLHAHGRRLIGWDEILAGGLPERATVMSWQGIEGGITAARQGHDVVMAPVTDLYLDYLQTASPDEPPGRPALTELRKVYAFDPVPAVLDQAQRKHVLGLQATAFSEHMRSWARLQHAVFPRIAAVAETGWTPAQAKDYDGFLQRLPNLLAHYRALGIAYAATPFQPQFEVRGDSAAARATVGLATPLGYRDIRYTTDGSAPNAASPRYTAPLTVALPATLAAQAFADGMPLAEPVRRRVDLASLRSRRDEDLAMCSGKLTLRLEDDGPREGERAIFDVDIFDPCWTWKQAALDGVGALQVRAGRVPYYFQLAHDKPHRRFRPARTPHGELVVRDGCEGRILADVALPARPDADGFATLRVPLPTDAPRTADLCVYFTGDTRPAMWVLDRLTLQPR
ncbi:family 20 glycosylhydrolase [Xanthomonas sp. AM6]|uniref:beta-N-acetylhexosaminidase n=1 Tax=Xanthomonas sp. AM6 TaxID=2982531 RepID=UPI0021DB2C85|nr:family 20 glycosylhydrolase [Xanthomonas sp. AM6]UYB53082.1 family 20 glycosylhydrolase [Xanthomonas sp. AM6]